MNHSPGIELATMFPPALGFRGACTTIRDLSRLRLSFLYSGTSKWLAVHLIAAHAQDCQNSHGKGTKAAKREGLLSTMRDECLHEAMRVREAREKKQMAAYLAYEERTESHAYPAKPSLHDA